MWGIEILMWIGLAAMQTMIACNSPSFRFSKTYRRWGALGRNIAAGTRKRDENGLCWFLRKNSFLYRNLTNTFIRYCRSQQEKHTLMTSSQFRQICPKDFLKCYFRDVWFSSCSLIFCHINHKRFPTFPTLLAFSGNLPPQLRMTIWAICS